MKNEIGLKIIIQHTYQFYTQNRRLLMNYFDYGICLMPSKIMILSIKDNGNDIELKEIIKRDCHFYT